METFEPGIKSPYTLYQFREGEQGMKCLRPNCPYVMTIAEWEDKRRCFCQFTNAVLATARSAPPKPIKKKRRKWGLAAILCIVFGLGWWTAQLGSFSKNYTALISSIQNRQPQLTRKQVITRYYQLAPSNRSEAKALLSDAFKKAYKQQNPKSNGTSSFWDSVNRVETYAFKTLSNRQIQVWLKYIYKNGETTCESRIVELIFDSNKSQWLIDKMPENQVEQNQYCDTQ
jgi:hypothetical protein